MANRRISSLFNWSSRPVDHNKNRSDGVTVVTTMHRKGFDQYGKEFLEGFLRSWPEACELVFYAEDFVIDGGVSDRVRVLDLHREIPRLRAFKLKHSDTPVAHGLLKSGYDYRFDAVRFSNKAYVLSHAAAHCRTRYMVWLDADTSMFQRVPANFIERVLDGGIFMAYLGRFGNHSEAGFLPFDLAHAGATEFFSTLNDVYESGELFKVREWHDSHIIDCCRSLLCARGVIRARDLNVHGAGHPFVNSAPGIFMDHKKGPTRKEQQRSRDSDYLIPPYWDIDWEDRTWADLGDALCPDEVFGLNLGSGWSAVPMILPALSSGEAIHYAGFYGESAGKQMQKDERLFRTIQSVYPEFSFSLEITVPTFLADIRGVRSLLILGAAASQQQTSMSRFLTAQPSLCLLAEPTSPGAADEGFLALGLERRKGNRGEQFLRVDDAVQSRRIDEVLGR